MKNFLLKISDKYAPRWLVLVVDLFLMAFSFLLTYYFRYLDIGFDFIKVINQLFLVISLSFVSFVIVGSYKGIIRHTGTKDALNVFYGVSIFSLMLVSLVMVNKFFDISEILFFPRSILFIHYLLAIFILILSRFVFKLLYHNLISDLKTTTTALIYGAGDSGILTYSALKRDVTVKYNIVGFVDDDITKKNKKIDRTPIYHASQITEKFINDNKLNEVIISIQKIDSTRLLRITDILLNFNVKVKIVPPLSKWIKGDLQANQIKQINIDDLLGRNIITINNPILKREFSDKTILVTGAAGSIGSEISRQLSRYPVKQLIIVDQAESPLYDLQQELLLQNITNTISVVADVRDLERMDALFEQYKPQKVFHAAAYKHVPLMETYPYEAVKINVLGTKNIADLALKYNAERFVMVSTDKAVNPTNVMGATKRVAEMYVTSLSNKNTNTKFTITRFGNVLGSNGSVIPLFKKQIEKGGPLTVTHKDITRFFMTIPEACKLVLEAGTMGQGGEVYIFDMGKPVKVYDMAKRMISLSGLKYPEDIDIKIVGLRPGEKLYEELLANGENTTKTYHDKIMIAKVNNIDKSKFNLLLNNLIDCNTIKNNTVIVEAIKKIVPEFQSNNSIYEKLDA